MAQLLLGARVLVLVQRQHPLGVALLLLVMLVYGRVLLLLASLFERGHHLNGVAATAEFVVGAVFEGDVLFEFGCGHLARRPRPLNHICRVEPELRLYRLDGGHRGHLH